jgi:hypothetical protein
MIVWLASFPRSGNTFLRTMLRHAFGQYSYSIYNDIDDIGSNDEVCQAVGHKFITVPTKQFYEDSMRSADIVLVKTHERPLDPAPAIYIVRDGRAAIVSYWNFLRKVRQRHELKLRDVIVGQGTKFGSWSAHLKTWMPASRPRTQLLRYEDLVGNPDAAITRIASFTGRPPIAKWRNNFQEMHGAYADFFNAASNEKNISTMTSDDQALFWHLHGDGMRSMGYDE